MSVKIEFVGDTWDEIEGQLRVLGYARQIDVYAAAQAAIAESVTTAKEARTVGAVAELAAAYGKEPEPVTAPAVPEAVAETPKRRTRKKADAPELPEPEPVAAEVEAQDAADEAAETEASAEPTLDDLRTAMLDYQNAYGIPAAAEDRPKVFESQLGPSPAPSGLWSYQIFDPSAPIYAPEAAGKLGDAIEAWKSALAENPFKRARVA